MSRCRECGARLSQYRAEGTVYCAAHEAAHLTHHDYVLSIDAVVPVEHRCSRGHDLRETRVMRTKRGKLYMKCRACEAEIARACRQRAKAAA